MNGGEDPARPSDLTKARRLERAGDPDSALALLRDRLRAGIFAPDELPSVGRLARRLLSSAKSGRACLDVMVLGQCTTTWLSDALTAVALSHDMPCISRDGQYDNVIQTLDQLAIHRVPDVLVLLPWNTRLLAARQDPQDQRIGEELLYWQQAWRMAMESGVRRMIQIGYDWTLPGAHGYNVETGRGGRIDLIRRMNQVMRDALPAGNYFLPVEEVAGMCGRRQFYDARRQYWTRQPFSEAGMQLVCEHTVAGIRALTTGPKKVLVLDLDNTLWGGVVGETGVAGIELGNSPVGEAFRDFQRHLRALSRRGILLTVCSKNNEVDAREPFQRNPNMILKLEDIACFVASWEAKPVGIRRIADELGLGLDAFVFFDDDAVERDLVRQTLPQVDVVDVPNEPSLYIETLQAGLWFEVCTLTTEDLRRTQTYAAETQRREAMAASSGLPEYLVSLRMRGDVRIIDGPDMQRVVQLLAKTNQFNMTTRRHTEQEVRRMLSIPGSLGITLRLADRFSDYGLVAVVIGVPDPTQAGITLCIDSFLMSCRIIGRTAEMFLMQKLLRLAAEGGYNRVVAEYVPSAKNQVVAPFLERIGFIPLTATADDAVPYELNLPLVNVLETFVVDHA